MKKQVLFIQGGGDDGYNADKALVASLQTALGEEYEIHYPEMPSDESLPDYGWIQQIATEISESKDNVIIAAHSFGASMLLKYLSESIVRKKIAGIFLLATPFWSGAEDWQKGFKLQESFADKLPKEIPLFLYQNRDDEEVPFSQFERYMKLIAHATFRESKKGGHQFTNGLSVIANDIRSL